LVRGGAWLLGIRDDASDVLDRRVEFEPIEPCV
jgi:hypothetical protein